MMNYGQLSKIKISGYKSIKECDLKLNNINVLIGNNGFTALYSADRC